MGQVGALPRGVARTLRGEGYRSTNWQLRRLTQRLTTSNVSSYFTLSTAFDVCAVVVSFPLAYNLRLGFGDMLPPSGTVVVSTFTFALIGMASLVLFGVPRGLWRHASTVDLLAIVGAASTAVLVYLPIIFIVDRLTAIPRTLPPIHLLVLIALLSAPRLLARYMTLRQNRPSPHAGPICPVLLVGIGPSTELLIQAISGDAARRYEIVGILASGPTVRGRRVRGIPVLGNTNKLKDAVDELRKIGRGPDRIILCETCSSEVQRRVVEQADTLGLTVWRLPDPVAFRAAAADGQVEFEPIPPERLLGRRQVPFDRDSTVRLIKGRRMLVTGAGGSIGSELARQIAACEPAELILVDNTEFALYSIDEEVGTSFPTIIRRPLLLDIRDRARLLAKFARLRPELVFHAAALKHVPMVESHPVEGVLTNVLGSSNVADAAAACGALAMVQISTDKAVNPTSVMGATKRLAEIYSQSLDVAAGASADPADTGAPRFMTVRFGNVLGSSGSVVPLFQRQLLQGGPLTVTHPEMRRYFMTIREAVELVLQATVTGLERRSRRGEVFVLDMGEPVRIVDLARQMIRLAGREPDRDVKITYTGLRPGEKLFEELFDRCEKRLPAVAAGVLAAQPPVVDSGSVQAIISDLRQACCQDDEDQVLLLLSRTVPGYIPELHVERDWPSAAQPAVDTAG